MFRKKTSLQPDDIMLWFQPWLCFWRGCGGGNSGNKNNNDNHPATASFALRPAFTGLNFSQITNFQAQAYRPSAVLRGDRIFVVQRNGVIKVFDNPAGVSTASEFLDIYDRVTTGGKQGLLGLVFHPQVASNGQF